MTLLRGLLLGIWYGLSDEQLGACLARDLLFRRFCHLELTRKQLKRGVHVCVRDLEADIMRFVECHNENPKPYKWTKSADEILASVKRFCYRVNQNLCDEL